MCYLEKSYSQSKVSGTMQNDHSDFVFSNYNQDHHYEPGVMEDHMTLGAANVHYTNTSTE